MTGLIRLDLASIRDAADNARVIRSTFEASDDSARSAASACGHDDLAATIERFASTWDDRRAGFVVNLGDVATALRSIDDAFTELDRSLATEGGS
jgi:hypothetical protein